MIRHDAIPYVAFVVDDAGNGRKLDADRNAIVWESRIDWRYRSVLVGWQCGFEPLFVAVHSYLDCRLDDDEVTELATDYLAECGWFSGEPAEPDYIIR